MKRIISFSWFNGQPNLPFEEDKISINGFSAMGWSELVQFLAFQLGIAAQPAENNRRIISYMHALEKTGDGLFFKESFLQDMVVTAGFLLQQRDELKWYVSDFRKLENQGDRLSNFALIEKNCMANEIRGLPDIYQEVCMALEAKPSVLLSIYLNEEAELYPSYVKHLLYLLKSCGGEIISPPEIRPSAATGSNLNRFQKQLIDLLLDAAPVMDTFQEADPSLILYKTRYISDATHELEAFLAEHKDEKWYLLRHSSDIQLAEVLYSGGGILSAIKSDVASLPLTQVLRSFCNLLWTPVDVEAVYEFLNLPQKPFPGKLARKLTEALLEAPGVNSSKWLETLAKYWENFNRENEDQEARFKKEQNQYHWWFEQLPFGPEEGLEIADFVTRLGWIREWADHSAHVQKDESRMSLFIELADLCLEISELVHIIVKQGKLTRNELDKLLNLVLKNRTLRTQNYTRYSSGIHQDFRVSRETDRLIWWNFSGLWEETATADFLWRSELNNLSEMGIVYFGRKEAVRLMRFAMVRKVLSIKKQLILSYSSYHGTKYNNPHSFWLYLKSLPQNCGVENLITEQICADAYQNISPVPLKKATGLINITGLKELLPRGKESSSSISNLLYYPHLYVLEDILDLRNRLHSSMTLDIILKGKIIHKFVETALKNESLMLNKISKARWREWCDSNISPFIEKEAALLNKSRYAADRVFLKTQMYSLLFNLFDGISQCDWQVESVETPFEKEFSSSTLLSGRTDLVVEKNGNRFVIDLKSGSSSYKESEIRENADWQLLLYSYFGHKGKTPAASAFFTIQKGEFIGRVDPGISHFKEVRPKPGEEISYENMLNNLRDCIQLRIAQLQNGEIEFRNSKSIIESLPLVLGSIRMKEDVNKFDNYLFLNSL